MLDKVKKIFELQSKINQIKQELARLTTETSSPDEKIKIVINGEQKIQDIQIDSTLLNNSDSTKLQKELTDCINQAILKSQKMAAEKAREISGLDIPGL